MDGLPVTIRLLDPPLHEFLPDLTELAVRVAVAEERDEDDRERPAAASGGRRGCTRPTRCWACAACGWDSWCPGCSRCRSVRSRKQRAVRQAARWQPAGRDHDPAGGVGRRSSSSIRDEAATCSPRWRRSTAVELRFPIGTMIELPRAALTAGQIAEARRVLLLRHQRPDPDDVGLQPRRRRGRLLPGLPRERGRSASRRSRRSTATASGRLVATGGRGGRVDASRDLQLGVCGEHGGDPESVHFFDEVGLDYVSCSPFRVPVARLEAGRAALGA